MSEENANVTAVEREFGRQDEPAATPVRRDRTEWAYRLVLLILLGLIFIPFMGSFGLWDPWETHYGEVGRQMIERGDWISPWWGGHWTDGGGASEGRYFYSKPVLLLWMMGMGLQAFGFSEWGIRVGVGLVVIISSLMIYVMGRQVFGRRAGVIMALVTTTSPFWAMLGRQAQTDMPFVGLMTAGMCFFLMAVFGKQKEEPATRLDYLLFFGTWLGLFIPQMQLLWVKFESIREGLPWIIRVTNWGPVQVALYTLGVVIVATSFFFFTKKRTKRHIYLFSFYLFIGLATLAKGLLGFALPGAIILAYLLVTREWGLLRRVELLRGGLIFVTVAFPWYLAMFARHGRGFYDRFFIHDHLRRLATGVHQTENGSFEHFIKWLGYGLFPWGSFVPAALARVAVGREFGNRTDPQRARLLLVLWFLASFCLFTLSNTKFHHYIFPCVPALAMLVGLFLDDLLGKRIPGYWLYYLSALGLFVLVGFDLFAHPEHLKNLFTYQYDRMWHASLMGGIKLALKIVFAMGLAGFVLLLFRPRAMRTAALTILFVASTGLSVWALDVYMPQLATDWSQGYLWDAYYRLCERVEPPPGAPSIKRYCREPVVSYRLNWRGETYYTQNEVIPLEDESDYRYFLSQNGDRSFFAIMQRGRLSTFRAGLSSQMRQGVSEVHNDNEKFILVRVLSPDDAEALRQRRGLTQDEEFPEEASSPE
ncbi:MAG: glycosyltransferase family 39 protein [Bradymonadales bacterium]|nr:glycosyltransferase family 39 protein [Bradymonadales bacterium]